MKKDGNISVVKNLIYNNDKNTFIYLGYHLKLTPTESKVLAAICKSERLGVEDIITECGLHTRGRGNVSVHVHSINKKACDIGGRKLVLFDDGAYRLNDYM